MSTQRSRAVLDAAAKQLSYRALSANKLYEKLTEKGFSEQEAAYAVAWMTEHRLLDDTAYAAGVVRSCTRKGYGAPRIRQELTRRGIEREIADAVLQDFSPDPGVLHALLEKRLHGDVSDRRQVEKAVAALQRRGFGWNEIRQALADYGDSLPEDEISP